MATRFGEDKKGQKNKTAAAAKRPVRNSGITNKNSARVSLKENVGSSVKKDAATVKKSLDTSRVSGAARSASQQAGGRALVRMGMRAGLAGAAVGTGVAIGTAIRKKMNENRGGVELSANSKDRLRAEANAADKKTYGPSTPAAKAKAPAAKRKASAPSPKSSVREGPNKNIDDDTRKRAMAFVKKGKK